MSWHCKLMWVLVARGAMISHNQLEGGGGAGGATLGEQAAEGGLDSNTLCQ